MRWRSAAITRPIIITILLTMGLVGSLMETARADYAPQPYTNNSTVSTVGTAVHGDIVGVGSDSVQYIANFLADGATSGVPVVANGFNLSGATAKHDKLDSLDATGDANGRQSYSSTETAVP